MYENEQVYKNYEQLAKLFVNGQKKQIDINELFEMYIKLFPDKLGNNSFENNRLKMTFNAKSMFNLLNLSYKDYINKKKQKFKNRKSGSDNEKPQDIHIYESSNFLKFLKFIF